jgi:hypothetical protein
MKIIGVAAAVCVGLLAQAQPQIAFLGYSASSRPGVAPGQLITVVVKGIETTPAESLRTQFSAVFRQGNNLPVPILDVTPLPTCTSATVPQGGKCESAVAVTIQIPYEVVPICVLCGRLDIPVQLAIAYKGTAGPFIDVTPIADQIHILRNCDVLVGGGAVPPSITGGLPCDAMITHADGTLVTASSQAKSGEQLVAYVVGLGITDPPQVTGQPAKTAARTAAALALDFNYRRNALATRPVGIGTDPPLGPVPVFAGVTPGFVGLYQVNFIVPPPPRGLDPCVLPFVAFGNYVVTNLTVSIGANFSFDGAGICVTP